MRARKDKGVDEDVAVSVVVRRDEEPAPAPKRLLVPGLLRFPLLVFLSVTFSSGLYSWAARYTPAGELKSVSRSLEEWWEVGALIGWRTFELGLGWFGDYDGYDLGALSLLSHGPPVYLLGTFYGVPPTTLLSSLLIDTLATYIPFRLLRPLSPAHAASPGADGVLNRDILTDFSVHVCTTLLAAAIYSVTLYAAYVFFLPTYLVTYFSNIPSIAPAHSATPITLLPMTLALGLAAKSFIFTPAVAASGGKVSDFDPESASLGETFWYNVWGYSSRTKVVIKRTTALILVAGVNTFVQTFVPIEGVQVTGAAVYSAVWVVASGITGIAFGVVSDV